MNMVCSVNGLCSLGGSTYVNARLQKTIQLRMGLLTRFKLVSVYCTHPNNPATGLSRTFFMSYVGVSLLSQVTHNIDVMLINFPGFTF